MHFIKKNYIAIVIFGLLIILRFIWIDKFPPGMQYDEVEYSLSSKTFQMMGTDLSGVGFPKTLVITKTLGKVSPIPYMALSPLWNIINLNIVTYRSLYVILNVITTFVFMLFLHYLFKKKDITLLGGILFLLNPWSFFLSRHGMDGSFALLFYLLGTIFLLKEYSKKNIIASFIFFFLGFFSYHGAKLYLIPFVIILSIYKICTQKIHGKKLTPYILIILSLMLTVCAFVIGGKVISGSILDTRSSEFVFTNTNKFSDIVNSIRTASIQSPFRTIMINKVIFAIQYFVGNYLETFSPTLLFLKAEVLEFHGLFYVFEVILLIVGFVALFDKNRTIFWLITTITATLPISTATSLSGFSVLNRAILLLPMLLIYITYGLYSLHTLVIKYVSKKVLILSFGLLYLGSFIFFQYMYFFILPIQINMHYQTNTRVLAKYLSIEKKLAPKIIIVASKPQVLFSGIVFYLPRSEQEKILQQRQILRNTSTSVFAIDNITITPECVTPFNPNYTYLIDHDKELCYKKIPFNDLVINQKDAGIDFSIVGGRTCQEYKLTRWLDQHLLSDFSIENMSNEQFCKRWIARPLPSLP